MVWQEQKPVLIWVSWGDPADLWPPPFPHVILFDMVKVFQITGMVFWLCQCMEFSGKNQTPFIVQFPDAPDPMLFHESLELAPVNADLGLLDDRIMEASKAFYEKHSDDYGIRELL